MLKRFVSLILTAAVLMIMACGCSSDSSKARGDSYLGRDTDFPFLTKETNDPGLDPAFFRTKKVGISLPSKDLARWDRDGKIMKDNLEAAGFEVDLQYAANDLQTQESQIANMISSNCSILVIAPISANSLTQVLDAAKDKDVTVISYDRLIEDTENVAYFLSFDNYFVGQLQAEHILEKLDIDNTPGPYNIELFAGDPSDRFFPYFYNGAMDVLKPYIDSGKLVVPSGQTAADDIAITGWMTEKAQVRMEALIFTYYYDGTTIDAVLCPNDTIALGVINALGNYYTGKYPVITGMDCDLSNVKCIKSMCQSMSVFKDTRILAEQAAIMVQEIYEGRPVSVNDTSTANNGVKTVPAFLAEPIVVDINNYKKVLIDSGYYSANQIS